jgi:Ca2+:H+ antiporter
VALTLYGVFVFVQTVRHRDYWLDPEDGGASKRPAAALAAGAAAMLVASLAAVVLLAEELTAPLDRIITAAGLPNGLVGVAVAAVVLLPEGSSAVRAARRNRLQQAMNLSLGSAIASIGLSMPVVAVVSLLLKQPVQLGLSQGNVVLLVLTLFMATLTLGTGRTTVLQGAVHLVICAVFLMVTAVP